jgi:hypothetical protein
MEPVIEFDDVNHTYYDVETKENYISVTTLIKKYEHKTDWEQVATNYARKHGYSKEFWLAKWESNKNEAGRNGTIYHSQREDEFEVMEKSGKMVRTNKLDENKRKRSINISDLSDGIYSELIVYNQEFKVAGQVDESRFRDREVYINDFKTSKVINMESYYNFKTKQYTMMTGVVSHLMDCNYNKFALQTSMYMYFLELRRYVPTKLSIEHTKDNNKKYFLPYLKKEVMDILQDYKNGKN